METIVELRTRGRGSSQQVWLEVSFAGLRPPVQLLDDLSMVGWGTPPIPPPPASAIDWATPDPTTGQNFTLNDYLVEHLVIDPPKGSAPLGRWNDADRKIHLQVVERVLARHGLELRAGEPTSQLPPPPSRAPAPDAAVVAPTPAPPSPPAPAAEPAAAAPAVAATSPAPIPEPATALTEAALSPRAPATTTQGATPLPNGADRIVADVPPRVEAALATAMANRGVRSLSFERVHRTQTFQYRASTTERVVLSHLRLIVLVPSADSTDTAAAIRDVVLAHGFPSPEITIEHVDAAGATTAVA